MNILSFGWIAECARSLIAPVHRRERVFPINQNYMDIFEGSLKRYIKDITDIADVNDIDNEQHRRIWESITFIQAKAKGGEFSRISRKMQNDIIDAMLYILDGRVYYSVKYQMIDIIKVVIEKTDFLGESRDEIPILIVSKIIYKLMDVFKSSAIMRNAVLEFIEAMAERDGFLNLERDLILDTLLPALKDASTTLHVLQIIYKMSDNGLVTGDKVDEVLAGVKPLISNGDAESALEAEEIIACLEVRKSEVNLQENAILTPALTITPSSNNLRSRGKPYITPLNLRGLFSDAEYIPGLLDVAHNSEVKFKPGWNNEANMNACVKKWLEDLEEPQRDLDGYRAGVTT